MQENNHLLYLANQVELAFQSWIKHPADTTLKKQYEIAKSNLDFEIQKCKDTSNLKHSH
jgi:hypothetical protein